MTPTGPAAPAPSADVSSATPLEAEVGQFFGDFTSSGDETPEPESTSAAGTTPAEPAPGTETETGAPDAAAGDATAQTPPSEGTTPDAAAPAATDDADPFADTTPATFMVNGKPVTTEDIRVFKEGGAVIRPEALPNVLNRLSERESLFERNRAQSQEYQTLAKTLEWTDTASGKTYTGPEAAIELRIGNASLFAENRLLVETLTDPDKLYALLTTEQVPDGNGGLVERVIVSPSALAGLQTQNELLQIKAAQAIREHYKGVIAEASKPQPPPINFEAETPKLIAQLATSAGLDATLLTAGDRQLLADLLPEHTKNGQASLKWQKLATSMMKDRAAQKAATQTVVDSTTKATKDAQARMAAAARGVKPATKPAAAAPAVVRTPQQERMADEGELFDALLSAGAKAMRAER